MRPTPLLSVEEMYRADRAAIAAGISGSDLMENAGRAAAEEILLRFGPRPTSVLCGPGNNGGDGFVIARHLRAAGAKVRLALLGEKAALEGDAARMARRWRGRVHRFETDVLKGADLVVDAVFGAGLSRALDGPVRAVLEAAAAHEATVIAVDCPSGVDGNSGQVRGYALPAAMTVSFFRPKTGHYLLPGRALAGELRIVDIGIPTPVLDHIGPKTWLNGPELWLERLPWPEIDGHKYDRGHVVVLSGPKARSGAARLGARAALRVGAGLVTVAAPRSAVAENAAQLTAVMVREWRDFKEYEALIADPRLNAALLGPGAGVGKQTRDIVLATLRRGKSTVLDADALTAFQRAKKSLYAAMKGPCIITPHEGEFKRLFNVLGDKIQRCREAASETGAVVLLKGADTVVAAPDGRVAVNINAPAELATAGSGDVLAGLCAGLLAQNMPAFEAAAAAAWMHGEAAQAFGPGLIAEDLPETLPAVLKRLRNLAELT